jgi:hypothetical protein
MSGGEAYAGGGFDLGPLNIDGNVFAPGWEQADLTDDGHPHQWERVLVVTLYPQDSGPALVQRWEAVIRCRVCRCPRCGSSSDPDPCMERRHHDGLHITLHGRFEPVGGSLPPLPPSEDDDG